MTTRTIYIYQDYLPDGRKVTRYRFNQNDSYGTLVGTCYRLLADSGKVLTDGKQLVTVIDTADPSQWQEVDEPQPTPENDETSEN